jgi:predicted nucleic acid-binding protein
VERSRLARTRAERVLKMAERLPVVLDSSVGVKWIKPESGREQARDLLVAHREGRVRIVVPVHFVHELVGVAVRHGGPALGEQVWSSIRNADLTVVALDDAVAAAAFEQCRLLGCSFYDALAPALAGLFGATLYSADPRAHERFAGAKVIG